jgi:hypothetical protein
VARLRGATPIAYRSLRLGVRLSSPVVQRFFTGPASGLISHSP